MEKNNPTIDRSEPVVIPDNGTQPSQPEEVTVTDDSGTATQPSEGGEAPADESSSQEDNTDYDSLIEAEKAGGKPDPQKAKERFERKRAAEAQQSDEDDSQLDDEDKPLTRKEAAEFLAKQRQQIVNEANSERIQELASEMADNDRQADFILEVHRNRIYPEGMSLRDQLAEAKAVADYKRLQVKNSEIARANKSKDTASRNTAGTQRDPQPALSPNLQADVSASLKRAGYTFNNQTNRYEKTLPNGKILATKDGKNPQLVG